MAATKKKTKSEPKTYTTGRLHMTATLLKPGHTGSEQKGGNTMRMRTEPVYIPVLDEDDEPILDEDGCPEDMMVVDVPYFAANGFKHIIRDGAVRFAVDAMELEDCSVSKGLTDLLFSGGHPTKSGQSIDLRRIRRVTELFPALSLCGYASGNSMEPSKVRVWDLDLLCNENRVAQRVPAGLLNHPLARKPASQGRSADFLTNREAGHDPRVARLVSDESAEEHAAQMASRAGKSNQMIAKYQTVISGSVIFGGLFYKDLTDLELAALWSALGWACEGRHHDGSYIFVVGGKGNIGRGRIGVRFEHESRTSPFEGFRPDDRLRPFTDDDEMPTLVAAYADYLRSHRDEVVELLEEVA